MTFVYVVPTGFEFFLNNSNRLFVYVELKVNAGNSVMRFI